MARELIAALPETLTRAGMTALWEQALDDISQGKMSLAVFMQKQLQWTRHLVEKGRQDSVKITAPVTPPARYAKDPRVNVKVKMVILGVHTLSGLWGIISTGKKKAAKRKKHRLRLKQNNPRSIELFHCTTPGRVLLLLPGFDA